jgi:predicted GTPase
MSWRDTRHALGSVLASLGPMRKPPNDAALRALFDDPPRHVVVGAVGSGKSTLLSRLLDSARPTGLGGMTVDVTTHEEGGRRWVDTPGIDDPAQARRVLDPEVRRSDVLVWVVDGLQPALERERKLLSRWSHDAEVRIVVSRADLLDALAREAVAARMARIAPQVGATELRFADARDPGADVLAALRAPPRRWAPFRTV